MCSTIYARLDPSRDTDARSRSCPPPTRGCHLQAPSARPHSLGFPVYTLLRFSAGIPLARGAPLFLRLPLLLLVFSPGPDKRLAFVSLHPPPLGSRSLTCGALSQAASSAR